MGGEAAAIALRPAVPDDYEFARAVHVAGIEDEHKYYMRREFAGP